MFSRSTRPFPDTTPPGEPRKEGNDRRAIEVAALKSKRPVPSLADERQLSTPANLTSHTARRVKHIHLSSNSFFAIDGLNRGRLEIKPGSSRFVLEGSGRSAWRTDVPSFCSRRTRRNNHT
jgi:hypothetical protein